MMWGLEFPNNLRVCFYENFGMKISEQYMCEFRNNLCGLFCPDLVSFLRFSQTKTRDNVLGNSQTSCHNACVPLTSRTKKNCVSLLGSGS